MPTGAPTDSAANIAMPVHDIDSPARCGATEAIDHDTHPVTNWLSPRPAANRPAMMMARLAVDDSPGMAAARYSSPATAIPAAPCSADRLPPCWSVTRPA
ncbi:hypothetical protein WJ972_09550 [Achromobacter insuavis]